jgi:hypothetical protein
MRPAREAALRISSILAVRISRTEALSSLAPRSGSRDLSRSLRLQGWALVLGGDGGGSTRGGAADVTVVRGRVGAAGGMGLAAVRTGSPNFEPHCGHADASRARACGSCSSNGLAPRGMLRIRQGSSSRYRRITPVNYARSVRRNRPCVSAGQPDSARSPAGSLS